MVDNADNAVPTQRPAENHNMLHDPARLRSLTATGLLDSPPEEAFDRAVRLATRLLGTPVGLVSLVDGTRQFFKAQTGLPEATAQARQTPLSHSFCQHVVMADAPLAVRDAREDPLVSENLAIRDLGVVAYLGVPVHAPDGQVLGSFCAIQSEPRDWTIDEQRTLEDLSATIEAEISLRGELARRSEMEARSTAAEERFRLALQAGQVGTYDFDPQSRKTRWDNELYAMWGLPEGEQDVFEAARSTIHPNDKSLWEADVAAALDPGGEGRHNLEMRIVRPDTGELRWLHVMGQAGFKDGKPIRLIGTVRDITAQKKAEERERLLTQELNHRVKNLFAVVSGMISMTSRSSDTPEEMASALRGRVEALASAHALIQPAIAGMGLTQSEITLQSLASAVLEPHMRAAEAVTLTGPPLPMKPDAASNLALALHELATNAAKYGALSVTQGRLLLEWAIMDSSGPEHSEMLQLTWTETGGPEIKDAPKTKGFGSTLIDMTLGGQLKGGLKSDWRPTGVCHELSIPVSHIR